MAFEQWELFPESVELEDTPGGAYVVQCSWCGLLVALCEKSPLRDCPSQRCVDERPVGYRRSWWPQDLPVGPFHLKGRKEDADLQLDGSEDEGVRCVDVVSERRGDEASSS